MISLLQKVLQKHHKWLFSILLVVVIVSFVFTVGSSPGIGRRSRAHAGKLFSLDLSSQSQVESMIMEVQMSAQLNYIPIFFQQQIEHMLTMRLAKLSIAEQIGIPTPTKAQIAKKTESYPVFFNESGEFSATKYNEMIESLEKNPKELAALECTIINDFVIEQVDKILNFFPNAFLNERAAEKIIYDNTQYSLQCAKIEKSSFKNDITYTDEEVDNFYNINRDNYKTDPKYVIDYIKFDRANFINDLPEASKKELQSFYAENKSLFKDFKEGSAELKNALINEFSNAQALVIAREQADNLSYKLYENNIYRNSVDFAELLRSYNLQQESFPEITLNDLPADFPINKEDLRVIEKMSDEQYFSDAIVGNDENVYILIYNETIPVMNKPFHLAKNDIINDLKAEKLSQKFQNEVSSLTEKLEQLSISSSDAFKMFAEQHDLQLIEMSNKTLSEITKELKINANQIITNLESGHVATDKYATDDEVIFFYLSNKTIPGEISDDERTNVAKQIQGDFNHKVSGDYIFKLIELEMAKLSNA